MRSLRVNFMVKIVSRAFMASYFGRDGLPSLSPLYVDIRSPQVENGLLKDHLPHIMM